MIQKLTNNLPNEIVDWVGLNIVSHMLFIININSWKTQVKHSPFKRSDVKHCEEDRSHVWSKNAITVREVGTVN